MKGNAAAVLTVILSAAFCGNSAAQEAICTPCGDTISVKERRYADAQDYRDALRRYETEKRDIGAECAYYLEYSEAYENALKKYGSVTKDLSYPAGTAGVAAKPLKKYAGNGPGHAGFDCSAHGPGGCADTIRWTPGGSGDADSGVPDGIANEIANAFVEFEEYYGIMPQRFCFTGTVTSGSEFRWYAPHFGNPVRPATPDTIEKPVFASYYGMHYHPRPLAPCDRRENPVMGCFSMSPCDFFRPDSEYIVTLSEYATFPQDLKEMVPGHDAWDERLAETRK